MRRAIALLALTTTVSSFVLSTAHAQAPPDVPQTHWAYEAVNDLASKGLIKGYPPDGRFLGKRTLTRYEMATIVQRVLAHVDEVVNSKADKADIDKLNTSIDEIRRLTDEFKMELTVVGTNMQQVKDDLAALHSTVSSLQDQVGGLTKRVDDATLLAQQTQTNLNDLKRSVGQALDKKIDVNNGQLRIGGLFQIWYADTFGKSLAGNFPTNFSASPPGRTFGGGVGDTFRLRRGYVIADGSMNRIEYHTILDVSKTGVAGASVLQDLWVGYHFTPRLRIRIGQMTTGMSVEGERSSSAIYTIERSIMNVLPPTAGRIGDVRDTGAMLSYDRAGANAFIGVFNDNGATQSVLDNDRLKFVDGGLYVSPSRHVTLGVWGGTNVGSSTPRNVRDRAGASVSLRSGPHTLEAEGAYTLDHTGGTPIFYRSIGLGGYVLYAHTISSRWQVVGRYDEWNPAVHGGIINTGGAGPGLAVGPGGHNGREYTLGVNYSLTATRDYKSVNNARIQLNYIHEDTQTGGLSFFGVRRDILLSNFQVAF